MAKARYHHDCTRATCRMFRERRDDNEEAARKRWRGATSGKEVCAEEDREAAVRPSRAGRAGRAIASEQEDR